MRFRWDTAVLRAAILLAIRLRLCCDAAEMVLLFWAMLLVVLAAFTNCALLAVRCWCHVGAMLLHCTVGALATVTLAVLRVTFFVCWWCWWWCARFDRGAARWTTDF